MKNKSILFVCLGNICRSPAAEGVMKKFAEGLPLEIDSAGTAGYHTGELPDPRMRSHAKKRGYDLSSRARKFDPSADFDRFDMIVAMDESNVRDLLSMDKTKKYHHKVSLMTEYCHSIEADHVPDPYYGGPEGFERVLDILEDACGGLLKVLDKK